MAAIQSHKDRLNGGPLRYPPPRARIRVALKMVALLGLLLASNGPEHRAVAQSEPVTLSGTLSLNGEAYGQSGLARSRRPAQSLRAIGQMNVSLYNRVTIPITLYGTTEGSTVGYQLPFNQLGISPTFGWATFHAGYFSSRFSEFTLDGSRMLGAGFELQPGPLRVAAVSGTSQRAVEPDSSGYRLGLYSRRLTAVQIGMGKENGWMLWITGLQAEDDPNSLDASRFEEARVVDPQENLVASVRVGLPIVRDRLNLEGEVAAAAYSGDIRAEPLDSDGDLELPGTLETLFNPLVSSRADFAARGALRVRPLDELSVQFQGRLVGPGFRSLGARQIESDVFDLVVNPALQLPKVSADVSLGLRENNVAGTRLATTRRTIANASVSVRPSTALTIAAQYSNFGLRSSEERDTLRIENVSQFISLSPSYVFQAGATRQNVRASYSLQDFSDLNVVSGRRGDTENHNVMLGHTVSWSGGLSLTTTASYTVGLTSSIDARILSLSESVGHQFLDRKLRANASVTWSRTATVATDHGIQGRLQLSYNITRRNQLQVSGQMRRFTYGMERNGRTGYTETIARIGYRLIF